MSRSYPSHLTCEQYELLSDLLPAFIHHYNVSLLL
jgi:hypothetical protein